MTEIKLCKDCVWYKKNWFAHITGSGDIFDRCVHPIVCGNFVTGKSNGYYCDTTRRFHECGMVGKLWEAKCLKTQ